MKTASIMCVNTGLSYDVEIGSTLNDFRRMVFQDNHNHILGALVNNQLKDLEYTIVKPKQVNFIDVSSLDGYSVYSRTLLFVLHRAVRSLFPRKRFVAEHFICNGIFCKIVNKDVRTDAVTVARIRMRMEEIIRADEAITREEVPTEEAIGIFRKEGLKDKVELLSSRGKLYTSLYWMGGVCDYFYGTLAPSTGCLQAFGLEVYKDGMLLRLPSRGSATELLPLICQDKLFQVFREYKQWGKILEVSEMGDLNRMVDGKYGGTLIKVSESLHEKKISVIADQIKARRGKVKVIMIAGPSSSGKTTFGKRLSVQLLVNCIKPVNLSLDNYFVNRVDTPLDEKGEYDYEDIYALDLKAFGRDVERLLGGEEVEIPKYSFEAGQRYYDGERLKLGRNNVLIIEGIHGLNPLLTGMLPTECVFKVFVSALTSISIDDHNLINPTDNRLIRRMVRDYKYRGITALDTLKRWESVLLGEQKHIVPYQEEADVMFNSALVYELSALKQQAEPLLTEVLSQYPEFSKAERLLKFFSYVKAIPAREIPTTSILREFLGGSSFKY